MYKKNEWYKAEGVPRLSKKHEVVLMYLIKGEPRPLTYSVRVGDAPWGRKNLLGFKIVRFAGER